MLTRKTATGCLAALAAAQLVGCAVFGGSTPGARLALGDAQPRPAGNVVLFGTGKGALFALDPDSGERRWNVQADRGFDARPLVIGGTIVAPSFDGVVHLLELASGTVRERRAMDSEVFSSPAAGDDLLYLGTMGGTLHALSLPAS